MQTSEEFGGRKVGEARGRKLNRQGKSVQLAANIGDRADVRFGECEVGPHRDGTSEKELDGRREFGELYRGRLTRFRQRERRHRVAVFSRQVQRRPARDEGRDVRSGCEDVAKRLGGRGDMFEVVNDEEARAVLQKRDEDFGNRPATDLSDTDGLGDGR